MVTELESGKQGKERKRIFFPPSNWDGVACQSFVYVLRKISRFPSFNRGNFQYYLYMEWLPKTVFFTLIFLECGRTSMRYFFVFLKLYFGRAVDPLSLSLSWFDFPSLRSVWLPLFIKGNGQTDRQTDRQASAPIFYQGSSFCSPTSPAMRTKGLRNEQAEMLLSVIYIATWYQS